MDFMEGIPAQSIVGPKVIILFTDDAPGCRPLAAKLRAEGDRVQIVDAKWFDEMSIEFAQRIIFVGASKREYIIQCYRSDYFRQTFGGREVEFVDMDAGGNVLGATKPEPVLKASDTLSAPEFALPSEDAAPAADAEPKAKK